MLGMKSKKPVPVTYRVDLVVSTGSYANYTSRKGTSLGMAEAYARGLKRQQTAGRIVQLPSETVVEAWDKDGNSVTPSS